MSIARHEGRFQVCCDTCPASYPNTYVAEDWSVMIADAKTAGWRIQKAEARRADRDTSDLFAAPPRIAGAKAEEPYTHTCPACLNPLPTRGLI